MRLWGPQRSWPCVLVSFPAYSTKHHSVSLASRHRDAFLSYSRSSFALAGYQLLLESGRGLVGLAWKLLSIPSKPRAAEGSPLFLTCGPVSWKNLDLEIVRGYTVKGMEWQGIVAQVPTVCST